MRPATHTVSFLRYTIPLVLSGALVMPAHALVEYKSVAEVAAEAEKIILGDVLQVTSYRDTDQAPIFSQVVVTVQQYLYGYGPGIETFEVMGGTVGDVTLITDVWPVFQVGDHVLLFLKSDGTELVQAFQGAYLTDGQAVARLAPGCARRLADAPRPLPAFLTEIEQGLPPGAPLPPVPPYFGDFEMPGLDDPFGYCGQSWRYKTEPMGESYYINANCTDVPAGTAAQQRAQILNGADDWNDAQADFVFTY